MIITGHQPQESGFHVNGGQHVDVARDRDSDAADGSEKG